MSDTFIDGQKSIPKVNESVEMPSTGISETVDTVKELKLRPYREILNVEADNPQENEKLEYILKWANPNSKGKPEEVLDKIRQLNLKVGEGNLGESKLDKIYKFVRIYKTINKSGFKTYG